MSQRRFWVLSLARRYARRRARRELDGVWVAGLDEARALAAAGPVIFAATHVSWWDAFMVVLADTALGTTSHCLMDAENLARLPFFGWIGAIPIDRSGGSKARAGLRRAAELTAAPHAALWIFPQGRQRPAHLRPLGLQPGVELLARLCKAPVVPVSLSYQFREGERPAALLRFGAPLSGGGLAELEGALIAGLDEIDSFVDQGPAAAPAFSALVSGPAAPSQDGLGARILRWIGGRRA